MGFEAMRISLIVMALGGALLMASSEAKALVGAEAKPIPTMTSSATVQQVQYPYRRHHHRRYYDRRRHRYYYR
jgi:hypothetical protein